ncbi:hypothetical protein [Salinispora arenicola]|uniref:hypothetical protein n=1 Tax=Salinispora arenicola TaxID=168697 RepID=UPI0016A8F30D|nr:hypothetical protein [Salinispora arenicola]NIL56907.1 hypothetical protein [Salinispora arenicola]NIL63096.1 hypothetical protein [Salinispora arenicola]
MDPMGIDWSYPNTQAVDATGVLDEYDEENGHPPGWTRSVIEKIKADINTYTPVGRFGGRNGFDRDDYTDEELAAWDWYQEDVVGNWDEVAEEHNSTVTDTDNVRPDEYNPDHQYVEHPPPGFTPPGTSEWAGGHNPNQRLSVSTEALEFFADQIDQIAGDGTGILFDARTLLGEVDMRPGGFAKAELMRQLIDGSSSESPGLRGDTMNLMLSVHQALYEVKTGLRLMVRGYDTSEEFNDMTADELGEAMGGAWSKIGVVGDHGQDSGTTSGG